MAESTPVSHLASVLIGELSILLVEDDPNDALLFTRAAAKNHLSVPLRVASDGEDAKAYLQGDGRYSDRTKFPLPRLIVTDLKMPRMNGFELLRWVKQHPACGVVPVVVLSSSNHDEDIERAFTLGANAFFVKPATHEELTALVKTIWDFWSRSRIPALRKKC